MVIPGIRKVVVPDKGLGLVAEVCIPAGTVVWFPCPACKRVQSSQLPLLSTAARWELEELGYYLSDTSIILPCGDFCYINHSCEPNILDSLAGFAICVSDIVPGTELTYDYRVFTHDPPWSFLCKCGMPSCRRIVTPEVPLPVELIDYWKRKLEPALTCLTEVRQPLAAFLDSRGYPFEPAPGPPAGSP